MFEVNGIAYASEKSNKISITDAKVTDHLMMIVTFSGGEKRVLDQARTILASELSLVGEITPEAAVEKINSLLLLKAE